MTRSVVATTGWPDQLETPCLAERARRFDEAFAGDEAARAPGGRAGVDDVLDREVVLGLVVLATSGLLSDRRDRHTWASA
jgi:hypothetical protein